MNKRRSLTRILSMLLIAVIIFSGCSSPAQAENSQPTQSQQNGAANYTLEQAMSDNAQLSTIAFSGLAFITGSAGADSFIPPGKVADFFGFQYMRDVDVAGYGHNTQFLTRVASNMLFILNDAQLEKLVALAKEQAPLYTNFAYNRFPIMNAFRQSLEGRANLSIDAVAAYTANLYKTDADLSYSRAIVVGEIISSFTDEQTAYFAQMDFNNFNTWPDVQENETLKKTMTNTEFVAVMTYASELFSWYKGSLTADVYFCPERHGTYFGGFFMKDYPAMNNPDYFISTAVTGDKGKMFLEILDPTQKALIEGIIPEQKAALAEIAQIRTDVSMELRKAQTGGTVDQDKVYELLERYGYLDGQISALYATRFSQVNAILTSDQRAALVKLRDLDVKVNGAYAFSTPITMPVIPDNDFMFGVGTMPAEAGQLPTPSDFGGSQSNPQDNQQNNPQNGVKVVIGGKNIVFDVPPVIKDGRTIVPIRAVSENLGAIVAWDGAAQKVTITKGSKTIVLTIGQKVAYVNGKAVSLEVPAGIQNGRTLVPIRFIGEAFGLTVTWDNTTQTATIK